MANRTVTNNPGNRGSQPSTSSTDRVGGRGQGEAGMQSESEGNPVPAGNPLGGAQPDVDAGKQPAQSDDEDSGQ